MLLKRFFYRLLISKKNSYLCFLLKTRSTSHKKKKSTWKTLYPVNIKTWKFYGSGALEIRSWIKSSGSKKLVHFLLGRTSRNVLLFMMWQERSWRERGLNLLNSTVVVFTFVEIIAEMINMKHFQSTLNIFFCLHSMPSMFFLNLINSSQTFFKISFLCTKKTRLMTKSMD